MGSEMHLGPTADAVVTREMECCLWTGTLILHLACPSSGAVEETAQCLGCISTPCSRRRAPLYLKAGALHFQELWGRVSGQFYFSGYSVWIKCLIIGLMQRSI